MLMAFTELRDLVAKNYQLETRIGHFEIVRKINSNRTQSANEACLRP